MMDYNLTTEHRHRPSERQSGEKMSERQSGEKMNTRLKSLQKDWLGNRWCASESDVMMLREKVHILNLPTRLQFISQLIKHTY